MANLMRPGMYGAYHHISIARDEQPPSGLPSRDAVAADNSKECASKAGIFDVVGGLCENNDKFAVDRHLDPVPRTGDVAVIHDCGAHGHSMGFNYNGKTRSAEYLYRPDGEVVQIRRAETIHDLFATLDFAGLDTFRPKRAADVDGAPAAKVARVEAAGTIRTPRNENFAKLSAGYLFPIIGKKRREYSAAHPDKKVISLGVGDTTHPLPEVVARAMADYATGLGTKEGYSGYDPAIVDPVKKAIIDTFYPNAGVTPDEVFVSDGSKCDLSRFQTLWSDRAKVAIPDPAYPAYVDDTVISGHTGLFNKDKMGYDGITYLPCTEANDFFPDLTTAKHCDIMYFCNPNNPTGACATRSQLETLVQFCIDNQVLLVYDAAYAVYIQDADKPKTIFEIPDARKIAIESNSFSKLAGFTGVRLGWTVVPSEVKYHGGQALKDDYNRVFNTHFNGAPNVALAGGLAALQNMDAVMKVVQYYQENTRLIVETFRELGFKDIYGGRNSPYVFVKFPGRGSWDAFDEILEKAQVICTPGVVFGPSGEGFVRISSYGARENVVEACQRFRSVKLGQRGAASGA